MACKFAGRDVVILSDSYTLRCIGPQDRPFYSSASLHEPHTINLHQQIRKSGGSYKASHYECSGICIRPENVRLTKWERTAERTAQELTERTRVAYPLSNFLVRTPAGESSRVQSFAPILSIFSCRLIKFSFALSFPVEQIDTPSSWTKID
jgi:hypothetical protein